MEITELFMFKDAQKRGHSQMKAVVRQLEEAVEDARRLLKEYENAKPGTEWFALGEAASLLRALADANTTTCGSLRDGLNRSAERIKCLSDIPM